MLDLKSATRALTQKQKKFADIFLVTQDAKKALKEAGYSIKNIDVTASVLKKHPKICHYLEIRAKSFVTDNIDSIISTVKALNKRDKYSLECYKSYLAIQDPKNSTKFKYLELLGKVMGHLDTQIRSNLIFNVDNRQLNHVEIIDQAGQIMQKLHKITGSKMADISKANDINS